MAEKKTTSLSGSIRPAKLPQVNKFLQEHGIEGVRLERGHGYFNFWGVPIDHWLNRIVVGEKLDQLTLDEWLEKYRQLEKQNNQSNPLGAPAKGKAKSKKK